MILHGLLADEQLFADFLVAEPLTDQLDDLVFAMAEEGFFTARAGLRGFGEGLHDLGGHAVVEPDFAGINAMDALDEQVRGGLLEDDAAGATGAGTDDVAVVFGSGEDHNTGR